MFEKNKNRPGLPINFFNIKILKAVGREPWSSGYSFLKGRGFESQRLILDGHFFALICCKICIVCLKRQKISKKETGVGPF